MVVSLRDGLVLLVAAVLLAPVAVLAQSCPEADQEALEWLDKMSRSVSEVSYHGVVTYQRGAEDMQVMQVSHSVGEGGTSEQLTQLTGQGAQVVRKDHPLECVHPGHKLLLIGQDLQAGHCGIAQHYRFSVVDGELVAGRKAVRVLIQPRDMYRYGYVMELDRSTGLLLKTLTIGHGKKVLEKFQFANLTYDETPPPGAGVDVVHLAQHPAPGVESDSGSNTRQWNVRWLPQGFTATDGAATGALRKTFTDGLAVFSIFVEELDRALKPGEGVVRKGSTTSYTRGMQLAEQAILVTIIGEVPVNTARMVADSVTWVR